MDVVVLLFKQNIVMLIYLLIGYFLIKKKILTIQGSGEIGKLLLYVIMPVAIVNSYLKDFSMEMLGKLAISFLAALGTLVLSIIVSTLVFHNRSSIRQFGAAFSNAGFIGIPLVQMTLGTEEVFYIASFVALLNILQWTFGVFVLTKDKTTVSVNKICSNPIVISFMIGILLFILPLQLPDILKNMLGTMASMNGPLAMLVLGAYLAQISIKTLFTDKQTYLCTCVRLLLIPLLTIFALLLVPKTYLNIRLAVLLVAAAPVGSNVAIFAQLYNKEYTDAVKDVCMSTVFSILTMPLMIAIANYIY